MSDDAPQTETQAERDRHAMPPPPPPPPGSATPLVRRSTASRAPRTCPTESAAPRLERQLYGLDVAPDRPPPPEWRVDGTAPVLFSIVCDKPPSRVRVLTPAELAPPNGEPRT